MRNEDDDQIEASMAELIAQGEYAPVHIAHMKSVYGKGAARAEELLDLMAQARSRGFQITADIGKLHRHRNPVSPSHMRRLIYGAKNWQST